jgi:hypothetical protein
MSRSPAAASRVCHHRLTASLRSAAAARSASATARRGAARGFCGFLGLLELAPLALLLRSRPPVIHVD